MTQRKNLSDMSEASQRRHGYADKDGYWTDKGYGRATNTDWDRLGDSNKAVQEAREKRDAEDAEARKLQQKGNG